MPTTFSSLDIRAYCNAYSDLARYLQVLSLWGQQRYDSITKEYVVTCFHTYNGSVKINNTDSASVFCSELLYVCQSREYNASYVDTFCEVEKYAFRSI